MCKDCGCQEANQKMRHGLSQGHAHGIEHEHVVNGQVIRHSHAPRVIDLGLSVLAKNDKIAAENRLWFEKNGTRVFNLISSPGSGKTLLLEKTVQELGPDFKWAIITGDQEKDYDAQRLKRAGANVLQLNTASACHLDASMIHKERDHFITPGLECLVIENVGNLVCPAAFDLGEKEKIAFLSCTEGEDKPTKYPQLFHEAGLIVLTKMDLVPHLDWNLSLCEEHIRRVNPHAPILHVSARTGMGVKTWAHYLRTGTVELNK